MSRNASNLLIAMMLVAGAPLAARAAAAPDLAKCAKESDDSARLACYDREVTRAAAQRGASARSEVPAAPAATAAPASTERSAREDTPARPVGDASAEADFGVRGSELARDQDREQSAKELKSIDAKVTSLGHQPRGELIFTLDNGQVWQQKRAQSYFPVEVGDPITIRRGALNSFRLIASGRSTAVTRIK